MRIDSHHHLWDLAVRDQPWTAQLPTLRRTFQLEELRPLLERSEIDGTVLVQTVASEQETRELLDLSGAGSPIRGVVGWVDLTAADVGARLDALKSHRHGGRLVGVRHSVRDDPDSRWLRREDVRRGLREVQRAGFAFDLLVSTEQLPLAREVADALPDLRFILDHAAQPEPVNGGTEAWRAGIAELASTPNCAVKLSGLINQVPPERQADLEPISAHLFDTFGTSRVLFGSDWPVCLLSAPYGEVVRLAEHLTRHLSGAEQAAVFGANAARWYELPEEHEQ